MHKRLRASVLLVAAATIYAAGAISLGGGFVQYSQAALRQVLHPALQESQLAESPQATSAPAPTPTSPTTPESAAASTKARASSGTPTIRANPFAGAKLFVDPDNPARRQMSEWSNSRPTDAALLRKIGDQSVGIWLGDWYGNVGSATSQWINQARAQGALPVFILYNIPIRDCGSYSAGGAASPSAYQQWVQAIAQASRGTKTVFVLEPDALAGWDCLSATQQQERATVLRYAIDALSADSNHYVYLDAGNARWHPASVMAERIKRVGLSGLQGVSLNVSNFLTTAESQSYGQQISSQTSGLKVVIDTSRNGRGPAPDLTWCNPTDRGLGLPPSAQNGRPVDAYLWLKYPGESDGACNGAPASGTWWADYALGLASRAAF